jgi:hypothetical protein
MVRIRSWGFGHYRVDKQPNPERSFMFRLTAVDFGIPRWLPTRQIEVTVPSEKPVRLVKILGGAGEDGLNETFMFPCEHLMGTE